MIFEIFCGMAEQNLTFEQTAIKVIFEGKPHYTMICT